MTSLTLTILDTPTGKGRPRFGNGRAYTPKKTLTAEARVRQAWHDAGAQRLPDEVPLSARIDCYLTRPSTHYKRTRDLSAAGRRAGVRPRKKPDVDNAAKLVLDALEGYAYSSDAAIVGLTVAKWWAESGEYERVVITISELEYP